MSYRYRVYGINLKSNVVIAGLSSYAPALEPPAFDDELEISLGSAPPWAYEAKSLPFKSVYSRRAQRDDPTAGFELFRAENVFQLSYGDGAIFLVDLFRRKIWGGAPPRWTQEDLVTYLVGPVLGFVLRSQGVLALHASSFSAKDMAFAISGEAGAGKSTLVAAFALRGFPVLCEDIAALREHHGLFRVAPGYPRINLWPEAARHVLGGAPSFRQITPNWEKLYLPLDGTLAEFATADLALGVIYILGQRSDDSSLPRIEALSPREAAIHLVRNTYMNYLLDEEQRAQEFDAIARLATRVPVKRLLPNSDPAKIPVMCELILSDAPRSNTSLLRSLR